MGPVTVAEVGVLKREIAYLSDVLNTAARIQGMCGEMGRDLLLSGSIHNALPSETPFIFQSEGEIALRGRAEVVELFSAKPDDAVS